jgi:hypothetical protein
MVDTSVNLAAASLTFSVLSFIMLAITLIFFLFPDFSATIRAGMARSESSGMSSSLTTFAAFFGALSPDITLLSGFVSDIINGSFRYSVTSIIGVISVIVHWVVAGLMYGFAKDSGPSAVAAAASALAAAASSSAATEQLLGTGSEPSSILPSIPPSGPAPEVRRVIRKVRAPGSVSTMSSLPSLAGPRSVIGPGSRTAALNSRLGPVIPGSRPSRSVTLRGGAEDEQMGGGWEIPEEMKASFNPCSIRGLGMFDISKSPMGMAALSSVFAVYLLDMVTGNKRSSKDILVYLGFSGVVYGLNLFSYMKFKCYGDGFGEVAKSTILPIVLGLAVGSAGFATLKTTFPGYLPLDAHNMSDPASPSKHATCAPPNDQDQFVCDAYKNGKRISSSVVA